MNNQYIILRQKKYSANDLFFLGLPKKENYDKLIEFALREVSFCFSKESGLNNS